MQKDDKKAENLLQRIQTILSTDKSNKVELAEVTTADGLVLYAEVFEAGQPIYVVTELGQAPAPVGSYTLADGKVIVIEVEGMIARVEEAAAPAAPAETITESLSKADVANMITNALKPVVELLTEMSDSKEKVKELEAKLSKISEQPANDGVKGSPEGKHDASNGVKLTKALPGETVAQRINRTLFA